MKLALVFLLGLVVFSHQQFYQQAERQRLLWQLHYYSPQPALNNYNYQSGDYHDREDDRMAPFFNHLTPSSAIPAYPQDKEAYLNTIENPSSENEDQFPDVQFRGKLGTSRFRPSFFHHLKPQYNPRIVINLASRTNLLNKVKTVTFTFTSSVTFTNVQSCIPSTEFLPGSNAVTCRRRRRELVESSDDKPEISQFAINPSDVQLMEPTVPSSLDPTAGNRNDPVVNYGIVSSKDEDTVDELPSVPGSLGYSRDKRFFFHFVTTTTAISYTFLSTTVTKTVNLLNPLMGAIPQLVCVPQGYAVCPYLGTTPPG